MDIHSRLIIDQKLIDDHSIGGAKHFYEKSLSNCFPPSMK